MSFYTVKATPWIQVVTVNVYIQRYCSRMNVGSCETWQGFFFHQLPSEYKSAASQMSGGALQCGLHLCL